MQCKELEAVLAEDGLSPLPPEAREHLAGCGACQDLVADLSAIVVAAHDLPGEVHPPERLWVSLRAQLEAEGIIREAGSVPESRAVGWWSGWAQLWRPRALATVATALLVVGGVYLAERWGAPTQPKRTPVPVETQATKVTEQTAPSPPATERAAPPKKQAVETQSASLTAPPTPRPSHLELKPSPSEIAHFGDSATILSQTEESIPARELANNATVDASLRQNLRTLNEFIAECEARLKQNPQDQLTREYLNMAYQQKAELLTAMMDSGRSEH
jgi:hypothetical protein